MRILLFLIFIIPVKVLGQTTVCIYKTNSKKVVKLQEGSDFSIKSKDGWRKAKDCIMDVSSQSLVFVNKLNPLSPIPNDTIYLSDISNIYYYNHYDFFYPAPLVML